MRNNKNKKVFVILLFSSSCRFPKLVFRSKPFKNYKSKTEKEQYQINIPWFGRLNCFYI